MLSDKPFPKATDMPIPTRVDGGMPPRQQEVQSIPTLWSDIEQAAQGLQDIEAYCRRFRSELEQWTLQLQTMIGVVGKKKE